MKNSISKLAVLINYGACQGRARPRWNKIRQTVLAQLPRNPIEIALTKELDLERALEKLLLEEQVDGIISAGGDGTIHYLINALLKGEKWQAKDCAIGAIGLGSSNDFHKPVEKRIKGIAVRINYKALSAADVGKVNYIDQNGLMQERFFLINASLGVTAAANRLFNQPDAILRLLKRRWTPGAIIYTTLKTILIYGSYPARIRYNDLEKEIELSNLAVLKKTHVSGSLCYDQVIMPNDGHLGLNYCEDMGKWELIKVLKDLGSGRFSGYPKRFSEFVKSLQVLTTKSVPLEMDGEIVMGRHFSFSLLPEAIFLMTT